MPRSLYEVESRGSEVEKPSSRGKLHSVPWHPKPAPATATATAAAAAATATAFQLPTTSSYALLLTTNYGNPRTTSHYYKLLLTTPNCH